MATKLSVPVAECRVCGCTQHDCTLCVERTGEPCSWIEADLCSACAPGDAAAIAEFRAWKADWDEMTAAV